MLSLLLMHTLASAKFRLLFEALLYLLSAETENRPQKPCLKSNPLRIPIANNLSKSMVYVIGYSTSFFLLKNKPIACTILDLLVCYLNLHFLYKHINCDFETLFLRCSKRGIPDMDTLELCIYHETN